MTPAAEATAPTLRSISPSRMMKVMAKAAMPRIALCRPMLMRFSGSRKAGLSTINAITIAAKAM